MRGLRRSVRKRIRWGVIIIGLQLCLLCFCLITMKHSLVKRYEGKLQEKESRLEAAGREVYITREEIKAGETFTEANVEKRYVLSEQDALALKVDAIGAVACVDLPAGIILNTSICKKTEYSATDRECTFQGIRFADCFEIYDVVDVRIRYGNGENYCVLQKKHLMPTVKDGACCFVLNETEQLMMSGASYDVEMYDGAELYLVGVPNGWKEVEPLCMFFPSEQVLLQLRELDGNSEVFSETGFELRKALEMRLREHRKQRNEGLI